MRALTPKAAMAAVLIAVASPASAAVITYSAEIPSDQTDFSTTVGIPKFDPTLGTLTSVSFTLFGEVTGDLWVENRNRSNAVTVTSKLEATLTLYHPDNTTIVVTVPRQVFSDTLALYDRTLDFGGTSGRTHAAIDASSSSSSSVTSSLPFDLALFTGPGSIILPMTANGTSSYDGTSNISFQADPDANGLVTVSYTYSVASVPEPMALSLFGVGLAGHGVAVQRRRRRGA